MKFTVTRLIDNNEVVPVNLLPEQVGDNFTWQIGDTDILNYNTKTKKFSLEVYEFINDDYELVNTLSHEDSKQVAIDNNIIS